MKEKNRPVLEIGSHLELKIEKMAHEGQGIGKVGEFTVFVEGAITGEKCIAKINKIKKDYAIAEAIQILEPSKERCSPPCKYINQCGGCDLQHLTYEGQLRFKTLKVSDSLRRIGHINAEVLDTIGMEQPWYYRNKSQYPVGLQNGKPIIGFYKKRSHDIVDLDNCMIQHPIANSIMLTAKEWIKKYNISVYDETKHEGLLRHVGARVGFNSKEVMVILTVNGRKIPFTDKLIEMLKGRIPGFKSLILSVNTQKTNIIMGKENILLYGEPNIFEYLCDTKLQISPVSFFQVNSIQAEVLYSKVMEYANIGKDETVIDVYCGTGTITLLLAKRAKKAYGIEIVSQAVEDAKVNAAINNIENTEFIKGAAEKILPEMAKAGIRPDVIVTDPPRSGCEQKALEAIVEISPKRIVYVSCNPATLARDLRYLEDNGYITQKVQPIDMFPQTSHVETIALMSTVDK
ncbi:23S rRNA (uracil-5-)-methyltransferase RumA [Tepidanaerobacter syntrophicus]|uniref:23S rRNA (uracil(1939)-C(5))-methyltransferase RlmD n=1 Tax=Tepidanaerobacter syntrophicus TaxID=224999 RepID=UPI0022EF834C|nr:23S rRNA (uracil(1939)-C(5))-methyltransferase RlmD [Tepidanaerobacter syntrophicus]GLI18372.1 23S rRNA (uracil-5-)-methyltransferase RumA [Tepidanaerobacter syntrophicus]